MANNFFKKREDAKVYISELTNEIIVTGMPDEEDETHNCDVMGCTSVNHVIFRGEYKEFPRRDKG